MVDYIVYDKKGHILKAGTCPDSMMDIQAQEGEVVMQGKADDSKHYIMEGEIVEFPPGMKAEKAAREQRAKVERDREAMIRQRMDEIVRKQAIDELKKEGKL